MDFLTKSKTIRKRVMVVIDDLITTAEQEYSNAIKQAELDHQDNLRQVQEVHETNKERIEDSHVKKVLGKFMN